MLADVWRLCLQQFDPIIAKKDEQEKRIEFVTGAVLDFWSLENPNSVRGRHYKRVIIDEAAMVKDLMDVWNAVIRPLLIDLIGDAWFFSTPKRRNDFFRLHTLGRDKENEEWMSWVFSSYDNPHLDPTELDGLRYTMSESEFRQEILAEFIEDSGAVFRNLDGVCVAPLEVPEAHLDHVLVVGVDWGKMDDFTALSIGCKTCRREVFNDRFNQIDYAFQSMRLTAAMSRWSVYRGYAEQNSMGTPILEALQRQGWKLVGFNTTQISKIALIENFSLALEQSHVLLLKDDYWRGELEAYERYASKNGISSYSAPKGMHDDTVIARALMWKAMQAAPQRLPDKRRKLFHPFLALKGL